ncbi:MAG: hypothetical protein V3V78_05060 [Candidatus Woesearchaeota archaeon]
MKDYLINIQRVLQSNHAFGEFGRGLLFVDLDVIADSHGISYKDLPSYGKVGINDHKDGLVFGDEVSCDSLSQDIFVSQKFNPELGKIYNVSQDQVGLGDRGHFLKYIEDGDDISHQVLDRFINLSSKQRYERAQKNRKLTQECEAWIKTNPERFKQLRLTATTGNCSRSTNLRDSGIATPEEIGIMSVHYGDLWDYTGD